MIRSELLRRALLIATCLLPTVGTALESDRQQPIYLEADSVELNERSGVSTYRGQVKLTQGTRVLTADKVTVEQTANGDRVVAEGRPATFAQRMENRPEPVEGQARRIEHSSADNRLILTGDADRGIDDQKRCLGARHESAIRATRSLARPSTDPGTSF